MTAPLMGDPISLPHLMHDFLKTKVKVKARGIVAGWFCVVIYNFAHPQPHKRLSPNSINDNRDLSAIVSEMEAFEWKIPCLILK